MAENVQYRQELKLPFYEDLRNSGILNKSKNTGDGDDGKGDCKGSNDVDIKELMHQEESFENKINSPLKTVDDYYDYIKFKKNLFAKLAVRGKGNTRALHLQRIIRVHMKKLYIEGLSLFPHDLGLWTAYIGFCKITRFYTDGSTAYKNMLTFHGGDPKYWLEAAQWECDLTNNMEEAKNILLSAINKHPDHPNLYIKLFKILLSIAESEESADYRLALAICENSKNCDFEIDYWAKVLEVAEEHKFSKKLQGLLVCHMVEKFVHCELLWHILAQREYKGYSTGAIIKQKMEKNLDAPNSEEDMDAESNANVSWCLNPSLKHRLELCSEIYQAAFVVVNTEKMWTYYIDAMLQLNKDMSSEKVFKRQLLRAAFSGALEAKLLTANHFCAYVDLLRESDASDELILEVLNRGLALYPGSAMPWEQLMHHYIIKDQEQKVKEIFEKACQELKEPELAYPLWRMMLLYYQIMPDKYDYVCEIFAKACREPSPIFLPFRVLYLEFCMVNQSIEHVRNIYEELTTIPPPYLELHKRMAFLESQLLNPDITNWRKCHQNAVEFFGKQRSDVWIDYMDFEKFHGDSSKISQIYKEATNVLQGDMKKKFVSDYNIFNAMKRIDLTKDD